MNIKYSLLSAAPVIPPANSTTEPDPAKNPAGATTGGTSNNGTINNTTNNINSGNTTTTNTNSGNVFNIINNNTNSNNTVNSNNGNNSGNTTITGNNNQFANNSNNTSTTSTNSNNTSSTNTNSNNTTATTTTTINKSIVLKVGATDVRVGDTTSSLEVAPRISEEGNTIVPIRFVAESLGAKVAWNGEEQMVTISLGSDTILLWINKKNQRLSMVPSFSWKHRPGSFKAVPWYPCVSSAKT